MNYNNEALSPQQLEVLLSVLKTRFEKTCAANKVLNGLTYKQSWNHMPKNCGQSMRWKELVASRIVDYVQENGFLNNFSMIVQQKAPKAVEVFVTTVERWNQGKSINQKIMRWIWLLPWVSKL